MMYEINISGWRDFTGEIAKHAQADCNDDRATARIDYFEVRDEADIIKLARERIDWISHAVWIAAHGNTPSELA